MRSLIGCFVLCACGHQGGRGLERLEVGGIELDLASGRTFFSVNELELGWRTRVVAKPRNRAADVRLRWETSGGAPLDDDAPNTMPLAGNQRVIVELTEANGDSRRWMVAIEPWDMPPVAATGSGPEDLFYFLAPRDYTLAALPSGYGPYLMIVDGRGTPVWWVPARAPGFDFRVTEAGQLTVNAILDPDERYTTYLLDPRTGAVLNSWFPQMPAGWDTVRVDVHEFILRADGSYVQTVTGNGTEDLTAVGGDVDGTVWHSMVREVDASGEIAAEWSTWGEVDLTSLPQPVIDSEAEPGAWRFGHINSIQDDDEGFLLSLRSPNQVVKVSRETEQVLWRVGGADGDFAFVDDPRNGFYGQHSARMFEPDHLTVFDNGTNFESPATGDVRAVEYLLDPQAGTATQVWEYALQGAGGTAYAGLVQRLEDGRTLIGWGSTQLQDGERSPGVTLLGPDRQLELDLRLPLDTYTYRAYAFPGDPFTGEWVFQPSAP